MGLSQPPAVPRRLLLSAVLALLVMALVPAAAVAAGAPRRLGQRPTVPVGAQAVGSLAQTWALSVTVTLLPRDPAGLAAYAAAAATPGSSLYHHYLSVSEFARRFGAGATELAAARAALRAEGLVPGAVAANGLSFSVTSSAARLGTAFHTGFERYHLRSGRTAYANTSAPQLNGAGASAIQSVIGLDDLDVAQPQALSRLRTHPSLRPRVATPASASTGSVTPCAGATDTGGYTADEIASRYGYNSLYSLGDLGSGVTVGLFELEPYTSSDVASYQSCYGTSATVRNESVGGGSTCAHDPACGVEDTLDIEDVIGLAPQARILVYEGPNTSQGGYDTYKQMVSDDTASVISTSWGMCEEAAGSALAKAENTLFQEAATQGQTVLAATGDSGTTDCLNTSGDPIAQRAVDDPASQPYVTGVGGTSLGSISGPETVWNDSSIGNGAGGGGVSRLWGTPSYQDGMIRSQSSIACGAYGYACREVPDVSADADPETGYDVYWNGGWGVIGGTSAATPTWASLIALADSSPACASNPVGFANPSLYAAARTGYASFFNDVTAGNNSYDGVTGFSAGSRYDMASGLGTPQGAALAAALCNLNADKVTLASAPARESSTAGRAIAPVSLSATSSTAATPITYGAIDLPAGLSINPTFGQVTGTPARPGTYSVTLTAVDRDGKIASDPFYWTVRAPAVTLRVVSRQTTRVGSRHVIDLHGADSVGAVLYYTASTLPGGMSIDHHTGVISGRPTRKGTRTVVVKAADSYGGSARRTFTLVIRARRG